MTNIQVEIELLSEAIFGCGESVSNFVDMEVLQDSMGIPYMKGKTFKGKLREEVEEIVKLLEITTGKDYSNKISILFGEKGGFNNDNSKILEKLSFSNCNISKNIRGLLKQAIESKEISKEYILSAFTEIRTFTSIDDYGIARDGALREGRVVKRFLKYYVEITSINELDTIEKGILAMGISSLRNLGAMESRGKGSIKCKLLENGKDVTKVWIEKLERGLN